MNLIVKNTSTLQGESQSPPSKSHSIRAIFLAALGLGESVLTQVLDSDDVKDAIAVCQGLGIDVIQSGNTLTIKSTGLPLRPQSDRIYSGNSGITTNFVMPLLGLRAHADQPIILDCGDQMRARPIKSLVDALSQLGLTIKYLATPGSLPVSISGRLQGGKIEIDGATSQHLSALLLALPCASEDSEITVKDLFERPYVEMTLGYLQEHDKPFSHESINNMDVYKIKGGQQYQAKSTTIQGDFSSASYLVAASALIPGETVLHGLNMEDSQGDKQLISILQEMGADIVIEPNRLLIRGGKPLSGIKIDAHDIPDLLPTLAVIGTYATGKTEIYHAAHARIKETDRIHSMTAGLTRMGAIMEEHSNGLTLYQSKLHGAFVEGYNDHRTVMALSVAGMIADGTTVISDSNAINKTFPTFVSTMQLLGSKMELGYGVPQ